jgi:hypothetical protein
MGDSQEITWTEHATVFVQEGRTVIPVLVRLYKHHNGAFDGYLMDLSRSDKVSRGHLAMMEADPEPTLFMGGRYWDLSLASGGLILSAHLRDEPPLWAKRTPDAEVKTHSNAGTSNRRIA